VSLAAAAAVRMKQHREIVTLPVAVTRSRVARGRVMTICRSHFMIWKSWKMMTGRCVCVRMDGEGKERGMQLKLVSVVQEHGSNWGLALLFVWRHQSV
jgi:hypothetical protein